jgi:hypothetical protein
MIRIDDFLRIQLATEQQHAEKDLHLIARSTAGADWKVRYGYNVPSEIWAGDIRIGTLLAHQADGQDICEDAMLVERMVRTAEKRARQKLADIEAKRAIISVVDGWRHRYVDEDPYFSCAQATGSYADPDDPGPGSGCADEDRAGGKCDCGLDRRKMAVLGPLALPFADRDGYDESWRP